MIHKRRGMQLNEKQIYMNILTHANVRTKTKTKKKKEEIGDLLQNYSFTHCSDDWEWYEVDSTLKLNLCLAKERIKIHWIKERITNMIL